MESQQNEAVLIVDDDSDQCALLEAMLSRLGYAPESTTSPTEALRIVTERSFSTVLTDLEMAELDGVSLCERLAERNEGTPVIVITGHGSTETAVKAMRAGAYDFLVKPVDAKLLGVSVARAAQHARLTKEVQRLREEGGPRPQSKYTLIGDSAPMRRVSALIERVADSDSSVLIQGETGTGKELVARAIHNASARKDGPFIAINCAAVPAALLESELFGHQKGAFTDAKAQRPGLFVQASGGTLFLDEIGEMPLDMQTKLLRALQERCVRPVGGNHEVAFDARLLAATHRDLESDIEANRFRQDLYYRINVVNIGVPPLRERTTDILKLATHFLKRVSEANNKASPAFSSQVAERLLAYDWPGNVRELENCVEHAVTLSRDHEIGLGDLPERVRSFRPERMSFANVVEEIITIDELEKRYITRVTRICKGNKSQAAQLLGLDRRTLYRKLERYRKAEAKAQLLSASEPLHAAESAP